MLTITTDKILIFSDLHAGIKSNSILRLGITMDFIDFMVDTIKTEKIKHVIFAGDWHHERPSIGVETMCHSITMIDKITKDAGAKLYFILGNHDITTNVSTDVNSVKWLQDNKNVIMIDKPTECVIGNKTVLLCPWLTEFDKETVAGKAEAYDAMIGHFDISHKYLIEAYVEDHKSHDISTAEISNIMIKSGYEFDSGATPQSGTPTKITKANSSKHIGSFTKMCKKNGYIYSGHIHNRRTLKVRGRNFTFLGSPMQLTWGDHNSHSTSSDRGFYIMDTASLKAEFIENNISPVHRKYFASKLPLDTESFSDIFKEVAIKGNFVRLVIDKPFEYSKLNELLNVINECGPIEPCVVDYDFSLDFENYSEERPDGASLKTSKLQYITDYVGGLDIKIFEDFNVDRDEILKQMEHYYSITEEQIS